MKDSGGRLCVIRIKASMTNFLLSETLNGRMKRSTKHLKQLMEMLVFVGIYTYGRHDLLA